MYVPGHNGSIGVFDSGIGGLSVANAISGLLPAENLLYVADTAFAPYGARTDAEVARYSHAITEFLLGAGAKLIVVACNTATAIAIDGLRTAYPDVDFVGLEPAVKPAATGAAIGVLATTVTLRSPRYVALREKYLAGRPVWENPCTELVPLIENYGPGSAEVRQYLGALLATAGDLDTVVLGCTHYPLVADDIRKVLPGEARIIDPSIAAARQVKRLLERKSLLAPATDNPVSVYDFFSSGGTSALQRTLLSLPQLNLRRRWVVPDVTITRSAELE